MGKSPLNSNLEPLFAIRKQTRWLK